MNSVFSAFKSIKTDGKQKLGGSHGSSTSSNKKITQDANSYENLRHIREIGCGAKMNGFVDGSDDIEDPKTIRLSNSSRSTSPMQLPTSPTRNSNSSVFDKVFQDHGVFVGRLKVATLSASETNLCDQTSTEIGKEMPKKSPCNSLKSLLNTDTVNTAKVNCVSEGDILSSIVTDDNPKIPVTHVINSLSTPQMPIIVSVANRGSESNLATSSKITRFQKRLSLSGVVVNTSMPSVHGRTVSNYSSTDNKKTRLSTHQRNLSLDFR